MVANAENEGRRRMSRGRKAVWAAAAVLLLLPLVAMSFTDEVNWRVGDFVIAGVLLFGALGIYEIAVRKTGDAAYRAGVGVAVAAALLLLWVNGAVGLTDGPADGLYPAVVAVGVAGAFLARFRPRGMAVALLATALAMVLVGVIALVAGRVPAHNSAFEVLALTAFFAVLFAGAAWLFREAARGGSGPDAT